MKLRDIIYINIGNEDKPPLIGEIHYNDPDNLYAEIVLINDNYGKICDNSDWVGFNYEIIVNKELKIIPKYFSSKYLSSNIYSANIQVESSPISFYNKLESGKSYKIVSNNKNEIFKSGTFYRFISYNDDEKEVICINPETDDEIEINVRHGISFLNNDEILYFVDSKLNISNLDSDSESDIDDSENNLKNYDDDEEDDIIYYISDEIPQYKKELSEDEKKDHITKSIREMFILENETLKDNNIAQLTDRVFNLLIKKDRKLNWENSLKFDEKNIIPIVKFDNIKNSFENMEKSTIGSDSDRDSDRDRDSDSENEYVEQNYINLSYDKFTSNLMKQLIIKNVNGQNVKDDIKVFDIDDLKYNNEDLVIFNKDNLRDLIVLQSSYNFSDKINIKKYIINPIKENKIIDKFPPSIIDFKDLYKKIKNDVFTVLNISIDNIPIKYIQSISDSGKYFLYNKENSIENSIENKKITLNELNELIKYKRKEFCFTFDELKLQDIKTKFSNIENINTDEISSLIWPNNNIWPRNLASSILMEKFKFSKDDVLQFMNEFENMDKFIFSEEITKIEKIKEKSYIINKFKEDLFKNNKKELNLLKVLDENKYKYSETEIIWNKVEKIINLKEKNEAKIEILTNGKYVRSAIYGKEDPFWFYDIFTNKQFKPIYTVSLLKKDIITNQMIKTNVINCLKNQWGEKLSNTQNLITSIVNNEILCYEEDNSDDTIANRAQNIFSDNNKIDNSKNIENINNEFLNIFETIVFEFSNKLLLELTKYKKNQIDGRKLSIDSLNCFLNNNHLQSNYINYNKYFNNEIFESTDDIILVKKNMILMLEYLDSFENKNRDTRKALTEGFKLIKLVEKNNNFELGVSILLKMYKDIQKYYQKNKELYLSNLKKKVIYVISSKIIVSTNIDSKLVVELTNKLYTELYKSSLKITEKELITNAELYWNYNIDSFDYNKYKQKKGKFRKIKQVYDSKVIIDNMIIDYNLSDDNNLKFKNINIKFIESIKDTSLLEYSTNDSIDFESIHNTINKNASNNTFLPTSAFLEKINDFEFAENQYKCLFKKFINIILIPTVQLNENFKFPKIWKNLDKEKFQNKINSWITFSYDFEKIIKNVTHWPIFINIIKDDIVAFKNELNKYELTKKEKMEYITWETKWKFLIYYLNNIIPNRNKTILTSNDEYIRYKLMSNNLLEKLLSNVSQICKKYLINMSIQKVQQEFAIINEDEASLYYDRSKNQEDQKIQNQDQKRQLGLFDIGQRKQYESNTIDENMNEFEEINIFQEYNSLTEQEIIEIEEIDSEILNNIFDSTN